MWGLRLPSFLLLATPLSNLSEKWKWKLLSLVRLFATPWTIQSMIFSRPEYWSGYPFPSPGHLPNPGIKPRSPTLQEDPLPAEPPGKPNPYSNLTPTQLSKCRLEVTFSRNILQFLPGFFPSPSVDLECTSTLSQLLSQHWGPSAIILCWPRLLQDMGCISVHKEASVMYTEWSSIYFHPSE